MSLSASGIKVMLEVKGLVKHYPLSGGLFTRAGTVQALNGVSLKIEKGQTLAVVGESGCGKSTLGRLLIRLEEPTRGSIFLQGRDVQQIDLKEYRRQVQMIFQDPYGSLNPRKRAWKIVAEPLFINTHQSNDQSREMAIDVMQKVGLRSEMANRYPHMFSSGQRQRLGVARALVMKPQILVCDEPVSALDVSIQAQVLNLLMDLQDEYAFSYVFISHDLSVVRHIADQVAVIYLGKVVENGSRDKIFNHPLHPYTQTLLAATPSIYSAQTREKRSQPKGELPSPVNPPAGCAFHKRCSRARPECAVEVPVLKEVKGREVACFDV